MYLIKEIRLYHFLIIVKKAKSFFFLKFVSLNMYMYLVKKIRLYIFLIIVKKAKSLFFLKFEKSCSQSI